MRALEARAKRTRKTTRLGPRFLRAFVFAAEKHKGQTRKASSIPYIAHLMGVASLVLEAGGDEDLAITELEEVLNSGGFGTYKAMIEKDGGWIVRSLGR